MISIESLNELIHKLAGEKLGTVIYLKRSDFDKLWDYYSQGIFRPVAKNKDSAGRVSLNSGGYVIEPVPQNPVTVLDFTRVNWEEREIKLSEETVIVKNPVP